MDNIEVTVDTCNVDHEDNKTTIHFPDKSSVSKEWDNPPSAEEVEAYVQEEMTKKYG